MRGIDGSVGRLVAKECCIQQLPHLSSGQEEERKVDSESKPQNRAGDGCWALLFWTTVADAMRSIALETETETDRNWFQELSCFWTNDSLVENTKLEITNAMVGMYHIDPLKSPQNSIETPVLCQPVNPYINNQIRFHCREGVRVSIQYNPTRKGDQIH